MTKALQRIVFATISAALFCFVIRVAWPRYLMWSAESQLNRFYAVNRPFPYRWVGAPFGVPFGKQQPVSDLSTALIYIRRAEASLGQSSWLLQLYGRFYLLTGSYDLAVKNYEAACLLEPENMAAKLELGIAFALRAGKPGEPRALDYEYALEAMLQAGRFSHSSEVLFDEALLFDEIPVPLQAIPQWQTAIEKERSLEWRVEVGYRLDAAQRRLQRRENAMLKLSASPLSYLEHQHQAGNVIEVVVEEAMRSWFADASRPITRAALMTLAREIDEERHDPWLYDLLRAFEPTHTVNALKALSGAWIANLSGDHGQADLLATTAERLFRRVANTSGVLRSRLELVYSLQRRSLSTACLSKLRGVASLAHKHRYLWMEGQAELERISCLTQLRRSDVIALREEAYRRISGTGYEGLRLRALSFLTESCVCYGSRLRVWRRAREGAEQYWEYPLSALRGYSFYVNMANSAHNAGDMEASIALLREATAILRASSNGQLLGLFLTQLGAWEMEVGKHSDATNSFDEAERAFNQLNSATAEIFRRSAEIFHAEAETARGRPVEALLRLRQLTHGLGFPFGSLPSMERRQLLPALGNAFLTLGRLDDASQQYLEVINQTREDMGSVRTCAERDNAQREIESAWRGLTESDVRRGYAAQALADWESFRGGRWKDPSRTPIRMPSGLTLLVYAFLPSGLSAWLADQNGVEHRWLDATDTIVTAKQLSGLAADRESSLSAVRKKARHINDLLIEPFAKRIAEHTVLVIDADGLLAGLPWAVLEDARGRTLLDRFPLSQISGWDEIAPRVQVKSVDTRKTLIFGEPTLGTEILPEYPPLLEARREAEQLQRWIPDAVFFEGTEATSENLFRYAPRSSFFYFAGHGASYGGFGALVLAPLANERLPARVITADQVAKLNLRNLQLAVLASCSSGAGEQSGIVNLESLVRGFLDAGAFRVVATRWTVSSQTTSVLMTHFYESILKGERPSEALRYAALKIRQNTSTTHPYFWAAFQNFGVP